MSGLGWLIYWIGFVDSVRDFALWLVVPSTIGLFVVVCAWIGMHIAELEGVPTSRTDKRFEIGWQWWRVGKNLALTAWIIGWVMLMLIPNRQTLILIAGAEVGQKIALSKSVTDIVDPSVDLLKSWIAQETKRFKGSEKKEKE